MSGLDARIFGKTLDNLAKRFVATLHPVAVKRIGDLEKEGIYIRDEEELDSHESIRS